MNVNKIDAGFLKRHGQHAWTDICVFDSIDSTSSWVKSQSKNQIVCLAEEQTAGRGRHGHQWQSPSAENIYLSLGWQFDSQPEHLSLISLWIGILVAEALADAGLSGHGIKWPNDIYVGDKKVAGILIQNSLRSSNISTCYLGVGLNINERSFPTDIPNPTSLALEKGQSYKLVNLVHQVTEAVEKRLNQLLLRSRMAIQNEYLIRLYRKDTAHRFLIDTQEYTGIIRGITEEGKLKLEIEGELRLLNYREMTYVID